MARLVVPAPKPAVTAAQSNSPQQHNAGGTGGEQRIQSDGAAEGAAVHGATRVDMPAHAQGCAYDTYGAFVQHSLNMADSDGGLITQCNSRYDHQAVPDIAEAGAAWGGSTHRETRSGDDGNNRGCDANSADEANNSADEAEGKGAAGPKEHDMDEDELEQILGKEKGFKIKRMAPDGACLFRAISDQIYGDPGMHREVRNLCMDYLQAERDHFSQFVTEDFEDYVKRKRLDTIFGNNLEMQAMSEMFNRPIEVYCDSANPMKIFHEGYTENSDSTPLRLSYHRGNHYNSVVNPHEHSVGEGLVCPLRYVCPRVCFFVVPPPSKRISTISLKWCAAASALTCRRYFATARRGSGRGLPMSTFVYSMGYQRYAGSLN